MPRLLPDFRAPRARLTSWRQVRMGVAVMASAVVFQLPIQPAPSAQQLLDSAAVGVKPVNTGLLMRGPAPPPAALTPAIGAYIIEEHWDSAQPTGPGDFVTTEIDKAVGKVRAWNATNPNAPEYLRLRIETGIYAPNWVKAMDGGPVAVRSNAGTSGTVARWWDSDVQAAYTSFVSKLAAYTDNIPEIREVTVGLTMEFFGEVFIRFPQENAASLEAAGFTQAADIAALETSIRANLAFQHTSTQLDVNAYEQLVGPPSLTITQQVMEYALSIGLPHVQFANASLDVSGLDSLYALMEAYGPKGDGAATLTFQSMPTVANTAEVADRAASFGASSLELPNNLGALTTLEQLAALLRSNAQQPTATLHPLAPTQSSTKVTVAWSLDVTSVPAHIYSLWVRDHSVGSWQVYDRTASTSLEFDGYPGHTYDLAIQADAGTPNLTGGVDTTTFESSAAFAYPFSGMYAVDAHGLLHGGGSAPITGGGLWPTWNIIRGLAVAPGGLGGYLLDGFGGLHPFGNAPAITTASYWPGWDIARGLALRSDGHSGYVLDGWGGLHPFGTSGDVPAAVNGTSFWQGWDIARDVQLRSDGQSGYILDGWGGLHPFGTAGDVPPDVSATGWWSGWDIAHRFALDSAGTGGYVMDGFGGLHAFGTPNNLPATPVLTVYWNGWDIARGIAFVPGSTSASPQGYVVDSYGGMHPFNGAPGVPSQMYTPGGFVTQLAAA